MNQRPYRWQGRREGPFRDDNDQPQVVLTSVREFEPTDALEARHANIKCYGTLNGVPRTWEFVLSHHLVDDDAFNLIGYLTRRVEIIMAVRPPDGWAAP